MTDDSIDLMLYPKKSTALWLLIASSLFVAGGIWMITRGEWVGYLCAGFFGLGILVFGIQLLPGSAYLHLHNEGFTFCSLFRKTCIPWSAIDEFFVVQLSQPAVKIQRMVGFNFAPSYDKSKLGRTISRGIAACEGALPDTYGWKPEELAAYMNECLGLAKSGSL